MVNVQKDHTLHHKDPENWPENIWFSILAPISLWLDNFNVKCHSIPNSFAAGTCSCMHTKAELVPF